MVRPFFVIECKHVNWLGGWLRFHSTRFQFLFWLFFQFVFFILIVSDYYPTFWLYSVLLYFLVELIWSNRCLINLIMLFDGIEMKFDIRIFVLFILFQLKWDLLLFCFLFIIFLYRYSVILNNFHFTNIYQWRNIRLFCILILISKIHARSRIWIFNRSLIQLWEEIIYIWRY